MSRELVNVYVVLLAAGGRHMHVVIGDKYTEAISNMLPTDAGISPEKHRYRQLLRIRVTLDKVVSFTFR